MCEDTKEQIFDPHPYPLDAKGQKSSRLLFFLEYNTDVYSWKIVPSSSQMTDNFSFVKLKCSSNVSFILSIVVELPVDE